MGNLTILHISDLHYEPTNEFDRAIVIDALLKDIRARRAEGIQFDVAIFSGDLVQSGDSAAGFAKVSSVAFRDLIAETELAIHGGANAEKSARIASLIEEGKDDIGQ